MKRVVLTCLVYAAAITMVAVMTSCEKDVDKLSRKVLLDGYGITAIVFDSKGNAWISASAENTQGETQHYIIRYNARETEIYNSDNSILPKDFWIWDMAIDKNDNVWIGGTGGLIRHDGNKFTLYNSENSALPEDIARSIAVDSKNNIWFASCRMRQGGLVKYDGNEWTVYTPDNSVLPVNAIHNIAIDQSDNIWLAMGEYVSHSYLVKISNDEWNIYTEKELGFMPYWWGGIQCDSKNRLWGSISYMLSSFSGPHFPHFFIFDGNETALFSHDDISGITIDNDDYIWYFRGALWIGNRWIQLDISDFGGSRVSVIKEAPDRRIWFGTENGIYIRETL